MGSGLAMTAKLVIRTLYYGHPFVAQKFDNAIECYIKFVIYLAKRCAVAGNVDLPRQPVILAPLIVCRGGGTGRRAGLKNR